MAEFTKQSNRIAEINANLLVIGNDERLTSILQRLGISEFATEDNVLNAIILACKNQYAVIFVNIELLGKKTVHLIMALRRLLKTTKIYLFGEAYTESFAKEAMRSGANNFFVWPILTDEINAAISGLLQTTSGAAHENSGLVDGQNDIKKYQNLSALAGVDKFDLIEAAQTFLSNTLDIAWVQIVETNSSDTSPLKTPSYTLPLLSPVGEIGNILLGPALKPGFNFPIARAKEIGMFIGGLVHLAQRCDGLKYLATVDELTGAYNRRYLEFYLKRLTETEKGLRLSLLMFDIDNFKHYNDTYSHAAGDNILRQATQLLKRCCREQDIVVRMGGDEFAVLFWDSGTGRENFNDDGNDVSTKSEAKQPSAFTPHDPLFLSNRFRRLMNTQAFPSLGPEARGALTISGGLANYPKDGTTCQALLIKADEALMAAKKSGKNAITLVGQPQADSL